MLWFYGELCYGFRCSCSCTVNPERFILMNLFPREFHLPQFRPAVHKSVKSILHVMQILEAMGSVCQDSKDLIPQGELKPKGEAVAVRITTARGHAVITNDVVTSSLNAVTSFGHAIVVITTKARVAEENLSHVIRNRSSVLLAV